MGSRRNSSDELDTIVGVLILVLYYFGVKTGGGQTGTRASLLQRTYRYY